MSGGKGGSTTSSVQIPAWSEDAAKANLARADQLAQIGYVPYSGPDVAAFTPMQQSAFANTGQAAGAFGLSGGGMTGMEGMPAPQTFAGGVQGYSSAPMYEETIRQLEASRPGQYAALVAPFLNPFTGAAPAAPFGSGQVSAAQSMPSGSMQSSMNTGRDDNGYMPDYGDGSSFASSALSAGLPGGVHNPSRVGATVRDIFGIGGTGDVANAPRPRANPNPNPSY